MTRGLLFPSYSVRCLISYGLTFDQIVDRLEIEPHHYDRVRHLIRLHHDADDHRRDTRFRKDPNHVYFS